VTTPTVTQIDLHSGQSGRTTTKGVIMKSIFTANSLSWRLHPVLAVAALTFAIPLIANALPANADPKPDGVASPKSAACFRAGPNLENRRVNDAVFPHSAQLRYGSTSIGCGGKSPGTLQPTDDAIYFCYTHDQNPRAPYTWTYLLNVQTKKRGWVRDDLLKDRGSYKYCGF
jgi:hypothetical protein